MKFTETSYTGTKEILAIPDHYVAFPVMVSDSGIVANSDGKKIVSAGTPVGGIGGSVLTDPTKDVEKKNTQGAASGVAGAGVDAEGILHRDVDVTYGPAPGSMIVHGFVDSNKVPEAIVADAVTALKGRILLRKNV